MLLLELKATAKPALSRFEDLVSKAYPCWHGPIEVLAIQGAAVFWISLKHHGHRALYGTKTCRSLQGASQGVADSVLQHVSEAIDGARFIYPPG